MNEADADALIEFERSKDKTEVSFKITMQTKNGHWVPMDSNKSELQMRRALTWYEDNLKDKTFRLEKHTMEILDV